MKNDKKLIQAILGFALILLTAVSTHLWAEEAVTQADNGRFVPVVSPEDGSNLPAENNVMSSRDSEDPSALSLPTDEANHEPGKKDPSVKDLLELIGLNEKETQAFLNQTEAALQSIDKAFKAETVSSSDYNEINKQLELLVDFASKHSNNENVSKVVAAVINSFFEKVEKTTPSSISKPDDSILSEKESLLQSLLNQENDDEQSAMTSSDSLQSYNEDTVISPERAKQRDQVMEQVLDVLRKGSVDVHSPAVSRAIYRSWYLSISKKARDLRFSRLRAMMLRQQNAETPSPAI